MEFFKALAITWKLPADYFFRETTPQAVYHPIVGPDETQSPHAAAPGGTPPPASSAAKETPKEKKEEKKEKSTVTIKLIKVNEGDKYKVLKEVRTIKPGMNLTESKAMVDTLPSTLKEAVPIEEAKKLVEKIKAAGGEVVLE